ncbi:unnamed protein product, partial [Didymodactylos carnosus]
METEVNTQISFPGSYHGREGSDVNAEFRKLLKQLLLFGKQHLSQAKPCRACHWTDWQYTSQCSETCGNGQVQQERFCIDNEKLPCRARTSTSTS